MKNLPSNPMTSVTSSILSGTEQGFVRRKEVNHMLLGTRSRIAALEDALPEATNTVLIKSLEDFPTPVAGVISLEADTIYQISGSVDIGSNRIQVARNVTIRGHSAAIDILTSSTTGALLSSSSNFRLWELGLSATSGSLYNLTGTGSEVCLNVGIRTVAGTALGTVDAYDLFETNICLFVGFTTGIEFSGSNGSLIMIDTEFFGTVGTTSLDLGTATFSLVRLLGSSFIIPSGGTGINFKVGGANMTSGNVGIIDSCYFKGAGTPTANYSALDEEWLVSASNVNVTPSDRVLPTGFGQYQDAATTPATQSLTSTYQKLQIDGGGAGSTSDYLPKYLRDSGGELWDTTNDKITPISIGDSYNLRVDLTITATGAGAGALFLQLDIGGGATPSNVILERAITFPKAAPFSVSVGFPIYTLSTFLTNGGQIFLATDTGTATLSSRSITIVRTSSGAI